MSGISLSVDSKDSVVKKPRQENKFTYREYETLLGLSLGEKIERADDLIIAELRKFQRPCVACSWGKDSIVLLHLVRNFCPNILVSFHNTGVEYPQSLAYRDQMLKEWNITQYVESKPIKSFWACVKEYGYPHFRETAWQGKTRTPKCCWFLKEKPAIDFHREYQIDCEFVGLQASESMVRRLSFFREGEAFDSKRYKCRIVRPLMIWTNKDIWEYHRVFNIPKNPLYDLMPRNGCMPCTGFRHWKEVMVKANPRLYEFVSKEIGEPTLNCFEREEK